MLVALKNNDLSAASYSQLAEEVEPFCDLEWVCVPSLPSGGTRRFNMTE